MTYKTDHGVRFTEPKPWGPLNKAGHLKNAPAPRTREQAQAERDLGELMTGEKAADHGA